MANYKLITFTPTAATTSQLALTASATNTVVSSVVASDSSTSTLEVLVKKSGGSIIELAHAQVQTDKPEELLTAPVALEASDELYVRTSRVGANFAISYVEETTVANDTALGGLADVDTTGASDGQSLVYDSSAGEWVPQTISGGGGGGGATALDDLTDVAITSSAAGHILRSNGTNYVNVAPTTDHISEGSNLYYTDARVDARIAADTTKADASHTHTLSDITDSGTAAALDVAATGDAAAGEVVKGDDTRLTDARTPTAHTHTASEITDFDTEVSNNTTVAGNTSLATAALSAANTATQDLNTHQSSIENHSDVTFSYTDLNRPNNAFIVWDDVAGRWEDGTISIDKCDDVDTTTTAPTTGDVLEWDGSNFVPAAPSAGSTTLEALTDTNLGQLGSGEVLKYDGSEWINDSILQADVSNLTTDLAAINTDITEAANFESTSGAAGAVGTGAQYFKNFDSGATLTAGKIYYLHATTGWEEADASAEATATNLLAMCTSDSTDGTLMLQCGVINPFGVQTGINLGTPLYLSETSGEVTAAAPTTSGAIARVIGYKVDQTDDTIFFNPSNDWIEIS